MEICVSAVRNGQTVRFKYSGQDEMTIRRLLAELGFSGILVITAEDFIAAQPQI